MSWRQAGGASNQPLQELTRLKEVNLDPLEAIGLPSKGDKRLLDPKTQEEYYIKILNRYRQLENANSQDDTPLDNALALLSLRDGGAATSARIGNPLWPVPETHIIAVKDTDSKEIAALFAAMRKLREGLVASARIDAFALYVYIFIIRATILMGHMESYHPALLHLLQKILPSNGTLLSTSANVQAFLGYYILDLACRQGDLGRAHHVRYTYGFKDANVEGVLRAMVRGDWCSYWRLRQGMDRYQERLCQWGDEKMRTHALDCVGASYLSVQRGYVEEVARQILTVESLRKQKPLWELEGGFIMIRRIKRK